MLIGMFTCEVAPSIISRSCIEKKELSIALCGCLHPIGSLKFKTFDDYINYLFKIVKSEASSDFIFDIYEFPKHFDLPEPILTLKRK